MLAVFWLVDDAELLGCHFFGFAFLPHELQFALGFLEGGRDFLLHSGSGFFELLRELDGLKENVIVGRPSQPDQALAFLDAYVDAALHRVFLLLAVVRGYVDLALTLGRFAELHRTIDLAGTSLCRDREAKSSRGSRAV